MQMRNSLTMPKEEVDALIAEGRQYVVRFKIEPDVDMSYQSYGYMKKS